MGNVWLGRVDPPGIADSRRWHQIVVPARANAPPGVAFLGFASDEGVRRNHGRPGAAQGPTALRAAMCNLPVLDRQPHLYDAGDVSCVDGDLEAAQVAFSTRMTALLESGHTVIGLGGGHEIAYASYRGLSDHLRQPAASIGIVNFDAHLDIREHVDASSGTSFLQAIRHAESSGHELRYYCVGASQSANTLSLFALAEQLGVEVLSDDDIDARGIPECAGRLRAWLDRVDAVYLTVCLDVLPQGIAPAVSAPNGGGLPLRTLESLVDVVLDAGKTRVIDIAELSPPYDRDNATARVSARLVHRMVRRLPPLPGRLPPKT